MQGEKLFALEEWVELANGCLCCSLKDDFLRALEALMEQRQRFDYILVETTGANPLSSAVYDHYCFQVRMQGSPSIVLQHGRHASLQSTSMAGGFSFQRHLAFLHRMRQDCAYLQYACSSL